MHVRKWLCVAMVLTLVLAAVLPQTAWATATEPVPTETSPQAAEPDASSLGLFIILATILAAITWILVIWLIRWAIIRNNSPQNRL